MGLAGMKFKTQLLFKVGLGLIGYLFTEQSCAAKLCLLFVC